MKTKKVLLASLLAFGLSGNVLAATATEKAHEDFVLNECTPAMKQAVEKEIAASEKFLNSSKKFDELMSASANAFQGIESCLQSALNTGLSIGGSVPGLSAITGQIVQQVGSAATSMCNSMVSQAKGMVANTLNKYSLNGKELLGSALGGKSNNMFMDAVKTGVSNGVGDAGVRVNFR